MQFQERIQVAAPVSTVARFLHDMPALLACLPNCREVSVTPDGGFRTVVEDRVGPFRARMTLSGKTSVGDDGVIHVQATGQDTALGSGLAMQLQLSAATAEGGTAVQVSADVQVRGKLASLGLPIFNLKAGEVLRQFSASLRSRLEGGAGA